MKKFKGIFEQHREAGRFHPVQPRVVKAIGPRPTVDSAGGKTSQIEVKEGSVQDKLYAQHQALRKKSGLPHPDYYKELGASYDIKDDNERYAKQAEIRKKHGIKEETELEKNSAAALTYKEKPNKEPLKKMKEEKEPPFDKPYKKTTGTVTDKSGAKHTPMSKVKDVARKALKKQVEKMKKMKESLDESRKAEIVKDIVKKKKKKTKESEDAFQPEPILTSQIVKEDK